jgi:hypothetical protein
MTLAYEFSSIVSTDLVSWLYYDERCIPVRNDVSGLPCMDYPEAIHQNSAKWNLIVLVYQISGKKVKLSLCWTMHQAMNSYGRVH